jgi:hypothetical protein
MGLNMLLVCEKVSSIYKFQNNKVGVRGRVGVNLSL